MRAYVPRHAVSQKINVFFRYLRNFARPFAHSSIYEKNSSKLNWKDVTAKEIISLADDLPKQE